jgi:hypothetical protein
MILFPFVGAEVWACHAIDREVYIEYSIARVIILLWHILCTFSLTDVPLSRISHGTKWDKFSENYHKIAPRGFESEVCQITDK